MFVPRLKGRPKAGTTGLSAYLEENLHDAIRLLVEEAIAQGKTLESLAKFMDRDPRALSRTLLAEKPRLDSIVDLAKALGFSPIVGRALLRNLTTEDVEGTKLRIRFQIIQLSSSTLFDNPYALSDILRHAWEKLPKEALQEALSRYIVADVGIETKRAPLREVAVVLQNHGFDLARRMKSPSLSEQRIANAALAIVARELALSAADTDALQEIIDPHLRGYFTQRARFSVNGRPESIDVSEITLQSALVKAGTSALRRELHNNEHFTDKPRSTRLHP